MKKVVVLFAALLFLLTCWMAAAETDQADRFTDAGLTSENDGNTTETHQETENGITATFVIPKGNAHIGQIYPIHYELSGGSNEFNDVTIQMNISTSWGSGSASTQRMNSATGDYETLISWGKTLVIIVHGKDSEGRSFYIELPRIIEIESNPDYPAAVTVNPVVDESGYSFVADYQIEGIDSFTGTGSWTVGENGEYSSAVQTVNLDMTGGQITLFPTFGDTAYLVIQGETGNGKPVYISEGPISIMAPVTEEIDVRFSSDDESAYIGKPYKIHYEINGGSGSYPEISVSSFFEYSWGGGSGQSTALKEASGDITIIPKNGVAMQLAIRGKDSIGKSFIIEYERNVPIKPNPDFPVHVLFGTGSFVQNKDYQVKYSIQNADSFSGTVSWTVGTEDINSRNVQRQEISESTGMISFTPAFGDQAWLVIQGEDAGGNMIYYESGSIEILDPENYLSFGTPDFILPAETMMIEDSAFAGASMETVLISAGCRTIGREAFKDCKNLKQVKIPAGCTVGEDAFEGCLQVFVYGCAGSPAEAYCQVHNNCAFIEDP